MVLCMDTIYGNMVCKANRIADEKDFTPEQLDILFDGGEIPVAFDENDEPCEWEALNEIHMGTNETHVSVRF